ncbi:hypothetical protein POK33_38545 [Burkholderia cenocepacia]|uniref:hypothetical protein n=1 Tax=Burkholderia cenocepacia TaxID=95486 RepID=UPI0023B923E7|nr:hypothetical protein [Burkholderia cenocepacia]MDF0506656.1 hypothetical protein [Burkholderia cenocepacia]
MYAIWRVEPNGNRILERDEIADIQHANNLVAMANHGAQLNGEKYVYVAEPVLSHSENENELEPK